MVLKSTLIYLISILSVSQLYSQIIDRPNTGLKSHETMEIKRVEMSPEKTIIYLSVENRRVDGTFCADKNIYIVYPDGSKIKLIKSIGIPECPGSHKFKNVGEVLDFTLSFPPLKQGTEWIDIVEDCKDNCFHFYGITLDDNLNKQIDEAFSAGSSGDPAKTMLMFRNILESVDSRDLGIEGALYVNIISAAAEEGDNVEAAVWYKRLLSSRAPRLNEFVRFLNERGIKF